MKNINFNLYRYQILPKTDTFKAHYLETFKQ
jgi:hypothetical protein